MKRGALSLAMSRKVYFLLVRGKHRSSAHSGHAGGIQPSLSKIQFSLSTGPSGTMLEGVLRENLMRRLLMDPLTILPLTGTGIPRGADDRHATRSCASNRASQVNGSNIYAFRANCSYRATSRAGFMLTVPLRELSMR